LLPDKPQSTQRVDFQVNERLRIRTGPLRGCFGLYTGQASRDRIRLPMKLRVSTRKVKVAARDVIGI
jgi:hypothetical protein